MFTDRQKIRDKAMTSKFSQLQGDTCEIMGLQRVGNIDTKEFRRKIDVDGLIEMIVNSKNGVGELNSLR